ncbi:MAG: hypothetical protein CMC82_01630 [Flavobacteriaceae bacterium]|nr:hypothetical protein [Flavobacteriaceae bacterium]
MSVDTNSILYQLGQAVKAAGESGGDVDLSDIETRLSAAESEIVALGGQTPPPTGNLTVSDVQWTNLTEINLSGEKILNGSFEATNIYTENTTVDLEVGQLARINTAFSKNNVDYAQFEIVTISIIGGSGNIEFTKADGTKGFIGSNNQQQFQRGGLWEVVDVAPNYQLRPDLTPAVGQTVKILQDVTYGYGVPHNHHQGQTILRQDDIVTITHLSVPNASASGSLGFVVEPGIADRGTKWEIVSLAPVNWEIVAGELDPSELAVGNVNGLGGNVALIQRFSERLTEGNYQVNVGRQASQTQSITLTALKFAPAGSIPQSAQVVWKKNGEEDRSSIITVFPDDNISFNPSIMDVHGIKINTDADARTITDISIFKGETSGGTVEVTGNSIRKINGADGFNSGASSVQAIPNGENGYFQFQYGGGGVRIGATYLDTTYTENESPPDFQIEFSGSTIAGVNYTSGTDFISSGDFFRIRHYSTTNQLQFQKRQDVYESTTFDNTVLVPNDGNDHIFSIDNRPFVRALANENNLVQGNIYRLHKVSTTSLRGAIHELDGTEVDTINAAGKWEVVTVTGQDYITFFIPSLLTTNGNLFLDVSLSQLTSQINDAKIATLNT